MAKVIVNDQEIEIGDDERLNGIQVAQRAGAEVPHYCWHPGLSVVASCRMCLVETGTCDAETGEVRLLPKLVPACQTPAKDGTVFVTNSPKVVEARAMVEEDLLIRHPIDCPICDKAGECSLQDYHFQHGRGARRADLQPFTSRRRTLGDTVTLFVDRCVMCSRCVRFCREVTETSELMVTDRGAHEEIDVFPGFPLDNPLSGNVVDLCPVGALGDREFLYQQRVWFMKSRDGVCAGCSTGCSIKIEENQDRIYRLKPRENPEVNQWWKCDAGRYGWDYVHDSQRATELRFGTREQRENVEWGQLFDQLSELPQGRWAAVVSPFVTVEEAFLLAQFLKTLHDDPLFVLGPVPRSGEDQTFSNGFTIAAEKCPNRRGVEEVLAFLGNGLLSWDEFVSQVGQEDLAGVWIAAGYPTAWHDEGDAEQFENVPLLVVQDLFGSPLWERANWQLPAVTFAERSGAYVNHRDHLQSFTWAIRPPAGAQSEGSVFWRLLGRSGMYDSQVVLDEVAREIPYFSAACGDVPEVGVNLRVNQLAGDE